MPGQQNFQGKSQSGPVATCGQAEKGEAKTQQKNFPSGKEGPCPSGGADGTRRQINFKYGGGK